MVVVVVVAVVVVGLVVMMMNDLLCSSPRARMYTLTKEKSAVGDLVLAPLPPFLKKKM